MLFGVTVFAVLNVKVCIPKSEVGNNECPEPRKIVNRFFFLQEKNNVKIKVKQNRDKSNAKQRTFL